MRGKKTCPKCSNIIGARSLKCPHCNSSFKKVKKVEVVLKIEEPKKLIKKVKKKRKKKTSSWEQIKDFKSLQAGEDIVVKGGPYYLCEDDTSKLSMGERGLFTFQNISEDSDYIFARDESGQLKLIYIGKERQSQYSKRFILKKHVIYIRRFSGV